MKYGLVPLKVIQFDDFKIFRKGDVLDGKLSGTIFKYPISLKKELPIQINWKYRLYRNKKHVFSFVAEARAIITIDEKEANILDIEMMIKNLYLPFELYWQEKTKGTPFQGSTTPPLKPDTSQGFIQNVLNWMKEIPL